jgi:integrase/recombinase XerD
MRDDGGERFLEYLKVKGYKTDTIKYTDIHIGQFNLWLLDNNIKDIREVTSNIIYNYQLYLTNTHRRKDGMNISSLTVLSKLSSLRKYFQFLQKQKFILLDPTLNLELPKMRDYLPKNILTQQEIIHLLQLPNPNTPIGIRDKAILELLYSSGIRRTELVNLSLYDANLKDQTLHIRQPKNKRDRIIPFGDKAAESIEKYLLSSRPKLTQSHNEKSLFLTQYGRQIKRHSLNYIIKLYSDKMKLDRRITPHCIRHTFATHLLQNGANLATIQRLLGHTRLKTTQIYTRISPEDLRQTIKQYHPRGRIKYLKKDFRCVTMILP